MKKGIDVSEFNNYIDWSKVKKAGIDFALIRSTFGVESQSQIDAQYFQNAQGCVKNNIPFATYHMAYFVNEQTAKAEANFAIKKANEYKQYIKFIVLDLEDDSERYAKSIGCNPDWTSCTIAFLEQIKSAGYVPVLYSNQTWLTTKLNYNKIKNYKLWYAAPYVSKPAYTCAIWQYDWKGKVSGINGNVDMDYLYDDSLFTATSTTATTIDDKTKFLNTARSYIGKNGAYVCKTKLGLKVVVDWCAYAVSAIMKDCGFIGKYQGGIYSYASDNARNDNGKYGTWFLKGAKTPQAGDLIMFKYASFTNPIDKYSASHIGIVESVNGNTITTLEGNVDGNNSNWAESSTFKRKTRYLNNSDVYSFFRINWKSNTTSTSSNTKTTSNKKTNTSSNKNEITELGSSTAVNYSVKVTSNNGVNIRTGASTTKKVIGAVPYNTTVKVTRTTGGDGYTWGLITYNGVQGWIALNYTKKIETTITFKKGDKVKVKNGAVVYGTNQKFSDFVYKTIFQIMEISGSRVVIGVNGQVTSAIDKKYLSKV